MGTQVCVLRPHRSFLDFKTDVVVKSFLLPRTPTFCIWFLCNIMSTVFTAAPCTCDSWNWVGSVPLAGLQVGGDCPSRGFLGLAATLSLMEATGGQSAKSIHSLRNMCLQNGDNSDPAISFQSQLGKFMKWQLSKSAVSLPDCPAVDKGQHQCLPSPLFYTNFQDHNVVPVIFIR